MPSTKIDINKLTELNLTPYIAPGKNNMAVIVCPGGSYYWLDHHNEGRKVGEWLQRNGITAFVLKYRTGTVPGYIFRLRLFFQGNQYPDPQTDLQRAIEHVKRHAEAYGVDPNRVGAMGFSAGGHLVMSVAERYDNDSCRPDFVAPIYPVVSFVDRCAHRRSMRGLLGDRRYSDSQLREMLSLERNIPADCPPVFLVNCKDDPIVDYRNSVLLDRALTAARISHRYIQYATGGHGFGANEQKGSEECRAWKDEFLKWIEEIYA